MNIATIASPAGRELYRAVWQLISDVFIDTNRLAEWLSWAHRFDDRIDSIDSALPFIDEMLASLNDTYTERVIDEQPKLTIVVDANASSEFSEPSESPDSSSESSASAASEPEKPADVLAVLTPSKVAYLGISNFDREEIVDLIEAQLPKLAGCVGVILDLRQNSGGRMQQALEACGFFLREGLLATTEIRHEDGLIKKQYFLSEKEYFEVEEMPDGSRTNVLGVRRSPVFAGKPIVIVFNRRTASAAELMIAALVQNGEVGKVHMVASGGTPGKGIGQSVYNFLDGALRVRVTRCRWRTPGGEWLGDCGQTEKQSIEPDTLVDDDRGPQALKVASDQMQMMLAALAGATELAS